MYSGQDIKNKFNALWDVYSAGQFSNYKLNTILQKAQIQYLTNLVKQYGINSEVDTQASTYLVDFTIVPTNNKVEMDVDLPNFRSETAFKFKFVKNGVTYYEYGKVLKDDAKGSPFKGSVRYPKYDFTDVYIRIYPENETCTEMSGLYFRSIYPIDVTSAVADLPFTDKNVHGIIEQALNIASTVTREDGYYQMSENEVRQNTNS